VSEVRFRRTGSTLIAGSESHDAAERWEHKRLVELLHDTRVLKEIVEMANGSHSNTRGPCSAILRLKSEDAIDRVSPSASVCDLMLTFSSWSSTS
jgi:hypothetical protein